MCEDNGEIDDDLPPLDRHENVGKFGFPILAMVELKSRSSEKNSPVKTASTGDTQFESNFTLITV